MLMPMAHVDERGADVDLALKEVERLGVVVEAMLDNQLDGAHVARLNVDGLLDFGECSFAQPVPSAPVPDTSLHHTTHQHTTHTSSIWYRS